jgi:hypothetical protein
MMLPVCRFMLGTLKSSLKDESTHVCVCVFVCVFVCLCVCVCVCVCLFLIDDTLTKEDPNSRVETIFYVVRYTRGIGLDYCCIDDMGYMCNVLV